MTHHSAPPMTPYKEYKGVPSASGSDAESVPELPEVVAAATTIVWDFDGVIADTEPAQARAYETLLARRGVTVPPGWFHDYVGTPELGIWDRLTTEHELTDTIEDLTHERSSAFIEYATALPTAWFVPNVLQLPCPHHIVSAGRHEHITALLQAWGLTDAFTSVSATGTPGQAPGAAKADRLRQAYTPGSVLFEDMPRYLAMDLPWSRVGVAHSYNDLTGVACDLFVDHRHPNIWFPGPAPPD